MAIKLVVKKDLKEFFPKEFSNRELIGKFIDYVMNHFFQSSAEEYINGYIGKKSVALEKGDFYIKEASPERQAYQLTPALVTTDSIFTKPPIFTFGSNIMLNSIPSLLNAG